MITKQKIFKTIAEFYEKDFIQNHNNLSIFKNPDGSYELYNKYHIVQDTDKKFKVDYPGNIKVKTFYNLKNAVSWCIFDQKNKIYESNRLEQLDQKIDSLTASIKLHNNLINKTSDIDTKIIYFSKISQDEYQRNGMLQELNSLNNLVFYWQSQQFKSQNK